MSHSRHLSGFLFNVTCGDVPRDYRSRILREQVGLRAIRRKLVSILLVVFFVADGQNTSKDSHCSYRFKDQLINISVIALPKAQIKFLAGESAKQKEGIRKLTDDNAKLRQKILQFKQVRRREILCCDPLFNIYVQ